MSESPESVFSPRRVRTAVPSAARLQSSKPASDDRLSSGEDGATRLRVAVDRRDCRAFCWCSRPSWHRRVRTPCLPGPRRRRALQRSFKRGWLRLRERW